MRATSFQGRVSQQSTCFVGSELSDGFSIWWGDSWCWTCGAMIEADYNETSPDDWHWSYDADYE